VSEPAGGLPATPYVGLVPYREEDADFFFGREQDAQIVTGNLRASRLTILYGSSGVGKTSLLHAAVIHDLHAQVLANADGSRERAPFAICSFSAWREDPLPPLVETIRAAAAEASGDGELPRWHRGSPLVETLRAWTERVRTLLVVLDQFEEYFLYHGDEDDNGTFAAEFPRIVNDPNLRVHFVLSLREDAWAKLDRFQGRIPRLFSNYVRIEHLSRKTARAAVEGPVAEWNRRLPPGERPIAVEPALVEAVIDQVRTGSVAIGVAGAAVTGGSADEIETPYLQLVLLRLWEAEVAEGSSVLRLSTLERLGGAERIVRTHLDSAMARLSPEQQKTAAPVFRYLVTPSGTKIAHRPSDLAEYTGLPEAEVAPVLVALSGADVRILRPTADGRYEIYHDVLAEPILDWRRRYAEAQRLQRRTRRLRWSAAAAVPIVAVAIVVPLVLWQTQTDKTSDVQLRLAAAEALNTPHSFTIFQGHDDTVRDASFSRDGKLLVSASVDDTARIWRVPSSSGTGPLKPLQILKVGHPLLSASFDPTARFVLTVGVDPAARVWDRQTGKVVAELRANDVDLDDASFSPDGGLVVTAGDDQTARVWDWRRGRPLVVLGGTGSPYGFGVTRRAVFSADGRIVATASDDGHVRLWDWRNHRILRTLRASKHGTAYDVALYGGSPLVVTAGQDGSTRVWDGRTGRLRASLFTSEIANAVAVSPDGRLVAAQAAGGEARIWNWQARQVLELLRPGGLERAQFSPDGQLVATPSYSKAVWLWTVERPDLVVKSLRPRRARAVTAVVANVGGASSSPTKLRVVGEGRPDVVAVLVPPLAPGAHATVSVPIARSSETRRGPLVATVNPDGTALESNIDNNSATVTLPDLSVETLGLDLVGYNAVATVLVRNLGSARTPATTIEATAAGFGSRRQAVASLGPRAKRRLELALPIRPAARGKLAVVTVTIDQADAIAETNEANNSDRAVP
jgi:WD40 repeat protein